MIRFQSRKPLISMMIFIVLAGFLLNGNKSKYCVLPDPCAGFPEVPGAGYARLMNWDMVAADIVVSWALSLWSSD